MDENKIQEKISILEKQLEELQINSKKEIDAYIANVNLQMANLQGRIEILKELLENDNGEE